MYQYDIAASIVAYESDPVILNSAIHSFLDTELSVSILIVDNSSTNYLENTLPIDPRVKYIHNDSNVGFSKAHNQAIRYFKNNSKYFLVLNPDVYFDNTTLKSLYDYLENNPEAGLIAPRVLYPTGDIQTSRRLIPSPLDLIIRRIQLGKLFFPDRSMTNEYQTVDPKSIIEAPFLLGCFLLFRTSVLNKVGLFDERFFVYLEDVDFCRRVNKHAKVVYYGKSHIYHLYQRASSKNFKMFVLHTISMIKYFNKWGWFNDPEREEINSSAIALMQLDKEKEEVPFSRKYAATL